MCWLAAAPPHARSNTMHSRIGTGTPASPSVLPTCTDVSNTTTAVSLHPLGTLTRPRSLVRSVAVFRALVRLPAFVSLHCAVPGIRDLRCGLTVDSTCSVPCFAGCGRAVISNMLPMAIRPPHPRSSRGNNSLLHESREGKARLCRHANDLETMRFAARLALRRRRAVGLTVRLKGITPI